MVQSIQELVNSIAAGTVRIIDTEILMWDDYEVVKVTIESMEVGDVLEMTITIPTDVVDKYNLIIE
jgi:hypothetical protein